MKCTIVVVTVLAAGAMGSEASAAGAPRYVGVIEEHNPSDDTYTELERQTPVQAHNAVALGLGSFDVFLEYPGEKSPVRFKKGTPVEFVLCVQHQDVDPQGIIQFWRLYQRMGSAFSRLRMRDRGCSPRPRPTSLANTRCFSVRSLLVQHSSNLQPLNRSRPASIRSARRPTWTVLISGSTLSAIGGKAGVPIIRC
jgi:hypothetical protein